MTNKSSSVENVNWQAQAYQYLVQEQYEQAASLYEQAITDEPEVKSYYWHLGLLLLLQGQEAEAWTTWLLGLGEQESEASEVATDELVQVLEVEAERRQELDDYQVAWTIRQYIRELSPSQINNLLQLIQLSIHLGNLTGEELSSLGVIPLLQSKSKGEVNPDLLLQVLPIIFNFLPIEPLTLEFVEACLPHVDKTQDFIESMRMATTQIISRINRIESVIINYEKTIQLNSAEAYVNWGNVWVKRGELEEALQNYRKALTLNPNLAEAHFNLGKILAAQGKLDEAIESLDGAIALKPEWSAAHYAKATIIKSAVEHNSKEKVDEWYSNPQIWRAYLTEDALIFYHDIVNLGYERGIDYNGKNIADIGCGTGHLLLSIEQLFSPSSLTGFDFSSSAIRVAREVLPNGQFYELDIYQRTNLKFDIVVCTDTLEHLLYPDLALKNLVAMINRSGVAFLAVPNGRNDTFSGHINFWSPESWEVFLKSVGDEFEVETGLDSHDHNFAIIKPRG